MTTLSRKSLLLSTLALLALAGAGCFSTEPAQPSVPQEPTKPPAVVTPPSNPSNPTPTTTEPTTPPVSALPPIDSTWKTYTNAALKFSFQYPTKGTYAPTWGVNILKPNDAKLLQGCYQGDGNPRENKGELQVGDTTFCITRYEDAGAGQRYETDYYVGGLNGNVILLTFSKHLTVGDNYEDPACHGQLVVGTGTTCKPVDIGLYNATLNQIVSTYIHE